MIAGNANGIFVGLYLSRMRRTLKENEYYDISSLPLCPPNNFAGAVIDIFSSWSACGARFNHDRCSISRYGSNFLHFLSGQYLWRFLCHEQRWNRREAAFQPDV